MCGETVTSLPKWIEEVAKSSQTQNMANYTPRLIQALGIAWNALEMIARDGRSSGDIAYLAQRQIDSLGKP